MGRPSNREQKRAEILQGFAQALADHGFAGATISQIAIAAGISPGLIHHHFDSKEELATCLVDLLMDRFRARLAQARSADAQDGLEAYVDAALKLDANADAIAAKCWVGLFAEALRNPSLFKKVRRMLEGEVAAVQRLSGYRLDERQASAIVAFVIGSLVFGAFAPRKAAGFAAPLLRKFIAAL
ncbi:MAG TPA: TetR/AcrR family transcriptional regulator [Polyangiaceae bacterium]|nr:TetR/AcrR family transcriptional regulator [Polyangiaceae bacterium]